MARQAGIKEVSFGYERSADEGNGVYVAGCEVNHQYDKSSAFLAQAQGYIARFIDPEVCVKSILHGMWELQVSEILCNTVVCLNPLSTALGGRRASIAAIGSVGQFDLNTCHFLCSFRSDFEGFL